MQSQHEVSSQLKVGEHAPRFSLNAVPGGSVDLDQFLGEKNVILAFYPKDNTPGCTREMCAFSADLSQFESADTVVLGISCDGVESHERFAAKFQLKQTLLSDIGGSVAKQFGVLAPGKSNASRILFVIDKNGIIQNIFAGMPKNAKLLEIIGTLK